MVIVLPTASSDTPHDNHPIDAQEHHSSGKRCTVQERTPPRWYLLIDAKALRGSTERACAPDRQESQPRTPRPALACPCKAPREPSVEKMPWAPTRGFPRTTQRIIWIRGSSGMSVARATMPSPSVRRHRAQCAASNQDCPTPIATVNGTARSMAPPIASVTTSRTSCSSPGATSRTSSSWICSSTRERSPCSESP